MKTVACLCLIFTTLYGVAWGQQSTGANQYPAPPATPPCLPPPRNASLTCPQLQQGAVVPTLPPQVMCNFDQGIFDVCPNLLQQPKLNNDQLRALASAALATFGPNPALWPNSTARCQSLGGILLGMNITQMMQCNFTVPNVAMAAGKLETNASSEVYNMAYRAWRPPTSAALGASALRSIGSLVCGMDVPDIQAMNVNDITAALDVMGPRCCFNAPQLMALANKSLAAFPGPMYMNKTTFQSHGCIAALFGPKFLKGVPLDWLTVIPPCCIRFIDMIWNDTQIQALTPNQCQAFTAAQMNALTQHQRDLVNAIIAPPTGVTSPPPAGTHPPPPANGTQPPPPAGTYPPPGNGTQSPPPAGSSPPPTGTRSPSINGTYPPSPPTGNGTQPPPTGTKPPPVTTAASGQQSGSATSNATTTTTAAGGATSSTTTTAAAGGATSSTTTTPAAGGETSSTTTTPAVGGETSSTTTLADPQSSSTDSLTEESSSSDSSSTTTAQGQPQSSSDSSSASATSTTTSSSGGASGSTSPTTTTTSSAAGGTTTPTPTVAGGVVDVSKLSPDSIVNGDAASQINSNVPPSDIQNLPPAVVQSPAAMSKILSTPTERTPTQQALLADASSTVLTNALTSGSFDSTAASIALHCGSDLPPKVASQLTNQQALQVFTSGSASNPTDVSKAADVSSKLANKAGDQLAAMDVVSLKQTLSNACAQQALNNMDDTRVANVLKVMTPVDIGTIQVVKYADLRPTEAKNLVNSYIATNVDMTSANDVKKLLNTDLTSNLASAIPSTQLNKVPSDVAATVLSAVTTNPEPVNVDGVSSTNPIGAGSSTVSRKNSLLADKVRTAGNIQNLPADQITGMVKACTISSADIKKLTQQVCQPAASAISPTCSAGALAYDTCKGTGTGQLGNPSTSLQNFGNLAIFASAADLATIPADGNLPNVTDLLCALGATMYFTQQQLSAILPIIQKRIDANPSELTDDVIYPKYRCFLPYLGATYINKLTTARKTDFCKTIACWDDPKQSMSFKHALVAACLNSSLPLSLRALASGCKGGCGLMQSLLSSDMTSCDSVVDASDLLAECVVDCTARKRILSCIMATPSFKLSDKASVRLIAPLMDLLSSTDFNSIPNTALCGLGSYWKMLSAKFVNFVGMRAAYGYQLGMSCVAPNAARQNAIAAIYSAESSSDCTGQTAATTTTTTAAAPTRKKRSATVAVTGLTCDDIKNMGSTVTMLPITAFQNMDNGEFGKCLSFLGAISGFSSDQNIALALQAKKLLGSVDTWSDDDLMRCGGIFSGLASADIAKANLNNIDVINEIGFYGNWSDPAKLLATWQQVKVDLLSSNVALITPTQLISLANIACGLPTNDIQSVPTNSYCVAAQSIGSLQTCSSDQLIAWSALAKVCFGSDVSQWTPSTVTVVGTVVGGLGKTDLADLDINTVTNIQPWTIWMIPTANVNGFTADQLNAMSINQLAAFSPAQFKALDINKQTIVSSRLSAASSEVVVMTPTTGGNNGCGLVEASAMVLLPALLAWFLKI